MFNGPTYNYNYYMWGSPPAFWPPLPPVYYPPVATPSPAPVYQSPQVINQRFEGPVENHYYESPAPSFMCAPPAPRHPVYIPPRRAKTPKTSQAFIPMALPAPSVYNLSPNTQVIMGTPYTGVNICNGCDGRQYCALHNPWVRTTARPCDEEEEEGDEVPFTPGMYCVPSPWMTPRKMGQKRR